MAFEPLDVDIFEPTPTVNKTEFRHIPLDHETIQLAKSLIPVERHGRTWVAGSAASRFPFNGDVDIWITDVDHGQDLWTVLPQNVGKPPITTAEVGVM